MNKDTNICISIASQPSNFGAYFHNQAYKSLGMNWVYLPRQVTNIDELKSAISAVRSLDIKGCSVSMPFKEIVIDFIDEMDLSAKITGAVNTILNCDGVLKGFNTDMFGAKKVASNFSLSKKQVLIIKHLISKKFPKINLVICNTVREKNGLAISSRNNLLNKKIYKKCGLIYDMLVYAKEHVRKKDINKIKEYIIDKINSVLSFELEYFEIRDSKFLEKIDILDKKQKIRAFICVKVDGIRLIDNMKL